MTTIPSLSTAAFRPRWSLAAALAYSGALVALVAGNWGLYRFEVQHRWWGLLLAIAVTAAYGAAAIALIRRGEPLAGGLAALLTATSAPWIVADLVHARQGLGGFFSLDYAFYGGYVLLHQPHGLGWRWIVVDVVALAVALALLRTTRFALLALPAVFAAWFLLQELFALGAPSPAERFFGGTETATSTTNRVALAAFVAALVFLAAGLVTERRGWREAAFWPHLAAPLAVFVGMTTLATKYDATSVAAAGLVLGLSGIALGVRLGRSAYGVVGGIAALATTVYFLEKAIHASSLGFPFVVGGAALALAAIGLTMPRWKRYSSGIL